MSAKWRKVRIDIPDWLSPGDREQLADDIIEHIRRRTESGLSKDGDPFPGYSKAYVKSLDFKIAGKDPSDIDLKLSGDMMAAMHLISHRSGSLLIGFDNGTPENDRADGNITGSYGRAPNRKKARDFLGIEADELDKILSFYQPPDQAQEDT